MKQCKSKHPLYENGKYIFCDDCKPMKPSERFNNLFKNIDTLHFGENIDLPSPRAVLEVRMVLKILDEEYEKNKPCDHTNHRRDDLAGYDICLDCNVIGNFS